MKIYVDFDRTLFDCDRFLGDLYALVNKYNVTKEMFKESQNQCMKQGFNPYIILDLVKEKYSFDEKLYHEIDNLMNKTSNYLYPDTISFLEYLKSLNYQVVILTKGNLDYQKKKILNANIDKYYDELIVTMKHKGGLDIDYGKSIFIDDNPIEILSIIKKKPNKIIRIQRDSSLYSNITIDKEVISVKSLKDIEINKILDK
jgi:FMN phosphatase YigB (HAD superfamily)